MLVAIESLVSKLVGKLRGWMMSIRSNFGSSRVGFKMWLFEPFIALFLIHIVMVESEPVESSDFLADAQSLHLKDWDADFQQEAVGALKSSASAAHVEKQPQASASAVAADPVNLVSQLLGRLQAAEPVGSIDAYCSQASRCIMGLVSPSNMGSPAVSAVNVPSPHECIASHTNGDGDVDRRIGELAAAVKQGDGKFDLQGIVGDQWYEWLKDPVNRADYKAVGKKYGPQREFRQKWAEGAYALASKTRSKTSVMSQSEEVWGTYECFRVIVRLEGDDIDGLIATVKLLKNQLGMAAKGKLLAGKRPFLMWNEGTERWEFLYIKKGFRDLFTETWKMETIENAAPLALEAAAEGTAMDDTPARALVSAGAKASAGDGKETSKAGNSAAAKKANAKAKTSGKIPKAVDENKKTADKAFASLKLMKSKINEAQASAADLKSLVITNKAWTWATKPGITDDLDEVCRFIF